MQNSIVRLSAQRAEEKQKHAQDHVKRAPRTVSCEVKKETKLQKNFLLRFFSLFFFSSSTTVTKIKAENNRVERVNVHVR